MSLHKQGTRVKRSWAGGTSGNVCGLVAAEACSRGLRGGGRRAEEMKS